ncbi:CPBP family intramembrane glutamic endopeptidase [Micromonospora sp. RTGN7]|uniref:CPBP family intramembrane glutamic endopeptidase n=1 Tax=Micromonospora sp. RTGN7 TaxID=3016526 RepID=UPI0029FF06C2|nr:CPBP family intramembrane glutamic endopeptidase [Micromonospora sp. RTGN7]
MTTAPPPAPGGFRRLVHRRPLTTFFALAYGLSWVAWIPYILSDSGLGWISLPIPEVLGTTQLIGMLPGAYLGPVTAALLVTAAADGRAGLRHWSRRLVRWQVGWRWYLVVLAGVPAVVLLSTFALPDAWGQARMVGVMVFAAYLPMLLLQFVTTAAAEEPGWRDFALPRLQRRYGAVSGTVLLGLLWGGWHLPLFLTEWGGYPNLSWVYPVEFVVGCVPLSLVMTWVFNKTRESLPLIMLLHAGINTTYTLVWSEVFPNLDPTADTLHVQLIGSTVVALLLIVATRGRLGLRAEQPQPEPAQPEQPRPEQPQPEPALPDGQERRAVSSR